jgi:hypothetical protein
MLKKVFIGLSIISVSTLFGCYTAHVRGLNPYGDNFLAVRSGPDGDYRKIDVLHNGDRVIVCDRVGRWRKVFYGYDCYLRYGSPTGDCYSGWAYSRYIY